MTEQQRQKLAELGVAAPENPANPPASFKSTPSLSGYLPNSPETQVNPNLPASLTGEQYPSGMQIGAEKGPLDFLIPDSNTPGALKRTGTKAVLPGVVGGLTMKAVQGLSLSPQAKLISSFVAPAVTAFGASIAQQKAYDALVGEEQANLDRIQQQQDYENNWLATQLGNIVVGSAAGGFLPSLTPITSVAKDVAQSKLMPLIATGSTRPLQDATKQNIINILAGAGIGTGVNTGLGYALTGEAPQLKDIAAGLVGGSLVNTPTKAGQKIYGYAPNAQTTHDIVKQAANRMSKEQPTTVTPKVEKPSTFDPNTIEAATAETEAAIESRNKLEEIKLKEEQQKLEERIRIAALKKQNRELSQQAKELESRITPEGEEKYQAKIAEEDAQAQEAGVGYVKPIEEPATIYPKQTENTTYKTPEPTPAKPIKVATEQPTPEQLKLNAEEARLRFEEEQALKLVPERKQSTEPVVQPRSSFVRLMNYIAGGKGAKYEQQEGMFNPKTGNEISGEAPSPDDVNKAITEAQQIVLKINPNKATESTYSHELFHPMQQLLARSPYKTDKAILGKINAAVEASPEYLAWQKQRTDNNLQASVDEYIATHAPADVMARLNNRQFGRDVLRDFWAHIKLRFNKANTSDLMRIMGSKQLYDAPGSYGNKINLQGKTATLNTRFSEDDNIPDNIKNTSVWKAYEVLRDQLPREREAGASQSRIEELQNKIYNARQTALRQGGQRFNETLPSDRAIRAIGDEYNEQFKDILESVDTAYLNILSSGLFPQIKDEFKSGLGSYLRQLLRESPRSFSDLPFTYKGKNYRKLNDALVAAGYRRLHNLEALEDPNPDLSDIQYSNEAMTGYEAVTDKVIKTIKSLGIPKDKIDKLLPYILAQRKIQELQDPILNKGGDTRYAEEMQGRKKVSSPQFDEMFKVAENPSQPPSKQQQLELPLEGAPAKFAEMKRLVEKTPRFNEEIDNVSSMSPDDFRAYTQNHPNGLTGAAKDIGAKLSDKNDLAKLQKAYNEASAKSEEYLNSGNIDDYISEASKAQFFSEAYGRATKTGASANEETAPFEGEQPIDRGETRFSEGEDYPATSPRRTPRFGFKYIQPVYDRIATEVKSPSGDYATDRLNTFAQERTDNLGKYVNTPLDSIKDFDIAQQKNVLESLIADDISGNIDNSNLTPEEQRLKDIVRQYFVGVRKDQNAMGLKVTGRMGKFNKTYFPSTLSTEAAHTLLQTPYSAKAKQLRDVWKKYLIDNAGLSDTEAIKTVEDYLKGINAHDMNSVEFNALIKAEGYGMPREMRDDSLVSTLTRYGRRVAKAFAHFKILQNDKAAQKILNLRGQEGQTLKADEIVKLPDGTNAEDISASPTVQKALEHLKGIEGNIDSRAMAVARVIHSGMLGVKTGVRNWVTLPFVAAPYLRAGDAPAVAKAFARIHSDWQDAYKAGAFSKNPNDIEMGASTNPDRFIAAADSIAHWIRKWPSLGIIENASRVYTYALGDMVATANFQRAADGDVTAKNWLKKFGKTVDNLDSYIGKPAHQVPKEVTSKIAKALSETVQGSYDERGLPDAVMTGPFASVFQLARWSVERSNIVYKDAIAPAMEGNLKPLLKYTLGAFIAGSAIEALNEYMSNKKQGTPTIKEAYVAGNKKELINAVIARMQLGSFLGFAGDLVATGAQVSRGQTSRITVGSIPSVEYLKNNLAPTLTDIAKAFEENGPSIDLALQAIDEIMAGYIQSYNIVKAHTTDAKQKRDADYRRDLRVYMELLGERDIAKQIPMGSRIEDAVTKFKRTDDINEAIKLLPSVIDQTVREIKGAGNNISEERIKKTLTGLRQMIYQTFPDPETRPDLASKYLEYLDKTQGEGTGLSRYIDFGVRKAINKKKKELVGGESD